MHILITNDDGYQAPGIKALYEALSGLGTLWMVAPSEERSGVSHAFTIRSPLRVDLVDAIPERRGYAVHGMPVDAVKIAIRSILPEMPALVVSGINQGENSGVDLFYSGTVAAAMEGAIFGAPSIAVSLASKTHPDFSVAAKFARSICERVLRYGLPDGMIVNVNVPPVSEPEIKGVKIASQAKSRYIENVSRKDDETGGDYFWVEYEKILLEDGAGTDYQAIRDNYVAVTPVNAKFTDYGMFKTMEDWELGVG